MSLFKRFDPAAFLAARSGLHALVTSTACPKRVDAAWANGMPNEWFEGFGRLSTMPPPDFPPTRWNLILADAAIFIDRWGATAAALGWTTLDLFGVGKDAPYHRLDLMGLVPSICGKEVLAMTETTARLKCGDGTLQTHYRKPDQPGCVPLWDLE